MSKTTRDTGARVFMSLVMSAILFAHAVGIASTPVIAGAEEQLPYATPSQGPARGELLDFLVYSQIEADTDSSGQQSYGEDVPSDESEESASAQDMELGDENEQPSLGTQASVVASGYCGRKDSAESRTYGTNITWTLTSDGCLSFVGSGEMDSWSHTEFWFGSPVWPEWQPYWDQITSVSIGNGITTLGCGSIANMPNITEVTLPPSIRKLDQCVFYNSSGLRTVNLNDGLESIGLAVFEGTSVTHLDIPASVTSIKYSNFNTVPLANVTFQGPGAHFAVEDGVLYTSDMTSIVYCERSKEGTFVVPPTVTSIDNCAFEHCSALSQVVLPDGLTSIGGGAFNLTGLTEVDIPDSVTSIGRSAFQALGYDAGTTVEHIRIGSGLKDADNSTFAHTFIKSVEISEGVQCLGYNAFLGCEGLTSLTLPTSYTVVESSLCSGAVDLESVTFGSQVTTIRDEAFANCSKLKSVSIPESVKSIGKGAFYGTSLTEITLPEGITSIGENAFYDTQISEVFVPSSVTSLGKNAFPSGCTVHLPEGLYELGDGSYKSPDEVTILSYQVRYEQTEARSMLRMVNDFRTGDEAWWYKDEMGGEKVWQDGLTALAYDRNLEELAMQRAAEIAIYFAHERPSGSTALDDFSSGYSIMGENLVAGMTTAASAMEAWKETYSSYWDQGHRRNMLNAEFNAIGIGHVVFRGVHFWVQELGYTDDPATDAGVAFDGTRDISVAVPNPYFGSGLKVTTSPDVIVLQKAGDTASTPVTQGSNITLRREVGGVTRSTFGSFSAQADVMWTSDDPDIVRIDGNRVVAVAPRGFTTIRSKAFGQELVVKAGIPADWRRLAGNGRYDTMASIVREGFDRSDWAVVAFGENFPDALVASSLAGLKGCPVVLTGGKSLSGQARSELERLGVTHAYVMGGEGVITDDVMHELRALGITAQRVAGGDRQETSIAALDVLDNAGEKPQTVVIATGAKFADALSIGPWCYARKAPIVLTGWDNKLTEAQVAAIRSLPSIENVVIIGGEMAVNEEVRDQLGPTYAYQRLSGADRYETSATVARFEMQNGLDCITPAVATGANFPDALAGAALCGSRGSVMLLAAEIDGGRAALDDVLGTNANAVERGYVFGGESAVSKGLFEYCRLM